MENQPQTQNEPLSTQLDSNQRQNNLFKFFPKKMFFLSIILILLITAVAIILVVNSQILKINNTKDKTGQKLSPTTNKLTIAEPIIPLKKYPESLQKGPFYCPTANSVCKNGTYKSNSLIANLAAGSPIYAAFDGIAEGLLSYHPNNDGTQEEFYLIVLTNKEKGLEAFYLLKAKEGKIVSNKEVKAGEQIATSSGQTIKFKENKSFIFELVKIAEEGATKSALLKSDFNL